LYEFLIHHLKPEVKHIAMYSDTCSEQSSVSMMCIIALQNAATVETMDSKFLLKSHMHMESDCNYSLTEKSKKSSVATSNTHMNWLN
jgi:hypothetical protein